MKNENLEFATDRECIARRNALISFGIIKPSKVNIRREHLIKQKIIDPNYCELLPESPLPTHSEEGECHLLHNPRPIASDKEYERRKRAYFRILQETLLSRSEELDK